MTGGAALGLADALNRGGQEKASHQISNTDAGMKHKKPLLDLSQSGFFVW